MIDNDYDENDDGQYVDEEDWYNDDFWEGAPSRIHQTSGPMDPEFLRAWRKRIRSIYKPEVMRKLGRDMNNRPLKPQPVSDQTLTDANVINPTANGKPPSKWGSYHDGFRMREYPEDKSQWSAYQWGKHMGLTNLPPSEYLFDRGEDTISNSQASNSQAINLQGGSLEGDGRWNMQSMIPETQYGYTQITDNGQPMIPPLPPGTPEPNSSLPDASVNPNPDATLLRRQDGPELPDPPHIITPAEGFKDPKRRSQRSYNPYGSKPVTGISGEDWFAPYTELKSGTYKGKRGNYTVGNAKDIENTKVLYSPISVNTEYSDLPGIRKSDKGEIRFHAGVDFAGNDRRRVNGEPIKAQAVFDGEIIEAEYQVDSSGYGFGNTIVVEHADGTRVRYAHLENYFKNDKMDKWKENDVVKAGDMIGIVGKSGTDEKHLHLEVWRVDDKGKETYYDPGAWFSRQDYNWKTKK